MRTGCGGWLADKGFILCKSKTRDERALTYGGYMITDANNNVVGGGYLHMYSMQIDQVERFLLEGERPL